MSLGDAASGSEKRCRICGETKPLEQFHRARARRDGRQDRCRPCNIELNKSWYREHPEARGERMDAYANRRRLRLQTLVLSYLRCHPCVDCGEADPVVLDFDHLRDKSANVSSMVFAGRPWAAIEAEIEKCEVVCANCHRRRTGRRQRTFRFLGGLDDGVDPSLVT